MLVSKTTLKRMYSMRNKTKFREYLSEFLVSDTGTILTSDAHVLLGLNIAGHDVTACNQGDWHAVSLNPLADHDLTMQDGRLLCDGVEVPFKKDACANMSVLFDDEDFIDPFTTPVRCSHFNVSYIKTIIDFLEEKRMGVYPYKVRVNKDKVETQRIYVKDNKIALVASIVGR